MRRAPAVAEALALAERDYANAAEPGAREEARGRMITARLSLQHFQRFDSGMPAPFTRLLAKSEAEKTESLIAQTEGQQRLDFVQGQQAKYGALWPEVYRHLDEGKRLPADVKILGAIPPGSLANAGALIVQRALAVDDKKWDELIPSIDDRKAVKNEVTAQSDAARLALIRAPGKGPDTFADVFAAAEKVGRLLYAEKRASSPEAGAREGWKIVFGNHFAIAGTVIVPRSELAAPDRRDFATRVAAFQDYQKERAGRGEMLLAPPSPSAGTPYHTEARRLEDWRRRLRRDAYFLADREDAGIVMVDELGRAVRLADGNVARWTWRDIESDAKFNAWGRTRSFPGGVPNPYDPERWKLPPEPGGR